MENKILDEQLLKNEIHAPTPSRIIGIAWLILGCWIIYSAYKMLYNYSSGLLYLFIVSIKSTWEGILLGFYCLFISKTILKKEKDLPEILIIYLGTILLYFLFDGFEFQGLDFKFIEMGASIILVFITLASIKSPINYKITISKKGIYLAIILLHTFSIVFSLFFTYDFFKFLH